LGSAVEDTVGRKSWREEPREGVEIVRNIQTEAARGVPFDQMAVLLNAPSEYRSHLEEAFSRAEIPVYFSQGSTAPDPAGRAMLALLGCAADGLSARGFAEYLSLGQVPELDALKILEWVPPRDDLMSGASPIPQESEDETQMQPDVFAPDKAGSSVIEGTLIAPTRWEKLLVESAVIGGQDRWKNRLSGLAEELELHRREIDPEEQARV